VPPRPGEYMTHVGNMQGLQLMFPFSLILAIRVLVLCFWCLGRNGFRTVSGLREEVSNVDKCAIGYALRVLCTEDLDGGMRRI
jgi:hypothetical protein